MIAKPCISVNKLAEYIESKAARQRQLLRERKYPDEDFNLGMYYREAAESVSQYLSGGAIDQSILEKQHKILSQFAPEKIGTARRINSNIDAIERFLDMLDDIDLKDTDPALAPNVGGKMTMHNVEIGVRPEIILRGKDKKGRDLVGAVKLHFSTQHPFNDDMAGYVSAVVQEYMKITYCNDGELVSPDYCLVIDTGSKKVFPGVKATAKRIKELEAECQNIAALWPSI